MKIQTRYTDEHIFTDRRDAGRQLAKLLKPYVTGETRILALPRGGVEVAFEVSRTYHLPLEVLIARKIGAPRNPEFAIGAIAEGDVQVIDTTITRHLHLTPDDIDALITDEKEELERRTQLYRNGRSLPDMRGKNVIIIDDGLATGNTARAAIKSIKSHKPTKIIFAAPVCSGDSKKGLSKEVDNIVCLITTYNLAAIGEYYWRFHQTTDATVNRLREQSQHMYGYHHTHQTTH